MGHEGMRASLVSREVIADSVELVMHAERFDGMVTIAGCDKSLPGMLMACARLNLPAVFLYGGTILPGHLDGRDLTVQDVFEAVGAEAAGKITAEELKAIETHACPGPGSCAGMYTANTMAVAAEALGMSLPGSASPPAMNQRRDEFARASGAAVFECLRLGLRPRDVMTKEAFENAITCVMACGGSTNAVLHLLAIAAEADVELELDDFDRISRRTPHIGDLRPAGRFVMADLDRVGGVPVLMKELLDAGLLHGDAMTVTGKTVAENLSELAPPAVDGDVVRPRDEPIHPFGGIAILRGSLAPDGVGRQDRRDGGEDVHGDALGCSTPRRRRSRRSPGGSIVARRRDRDPVRGAAGRSRDARDAGGDRGGPRGRAGPRRDARDRRAVQRRDARVLDRRTSRRRRRSAARSRWCATATRSRWTSMRGGSTWTSTRTSWTGGATGGRRRSRDTSTARWRSTRAWWRRRRAARSAASARLLVER